MPITSTLVFEKETYHIIGACIKVHKHLGKGFDEAVYKEAIAHELSKAEVPFEQQKKLNIYYNGNKLDSHFVADFVCFKKILVEIKSFDFLNLNIKKQSINHLKSTNFEVGLLINFGENSLKWKRLINTLPQ